MPVHTVQPGESLSSIARRYGMAGWQSLYFHPANSRFRASNPDPDAIRPGTKLEIPSDRVQQRAVLQRRLQALQRTRTEAQSVFKQQADELDAALREINRHGQTVDTAATVLTLIANLATLTVKANGIMKLEGAALEEASRRFAVDAAKDRGKNARDLAAAAVAQARKDSGGTVWVITRSVAQAWCDMTSPSFWANTITNLLDGKSWSHAVTNRPGDVIADARRRLEATRTQALLRIDERIKETQAELMAAALP